MEMLSLVLGLISILSFIGGLFSVYRALDKRVTVLEATHQLQINDVNDKILQLREDMKEQIILFKQELKNHIEIHTDIVNSLKQDHKEIVVSFQTLNESVIKLNTTMEILLKDKTP